MALNNQDLVLERLSVLQLAARSRREQGLEDGLQLPAHEKEARIRSGFVKNDLVQVWNRDQTCMRMRSSDEGNGRRNLQEGTKVQASTQSWHTSTESTPQIVPASGNEAGASGEDNTLLSD